MFFKKTFWLQLTKLYAMMTADFEIKLKFY